MAVPNPPVTGQIVDATNLNADFNYLEALAGSKLSSPVANNQLQNSKYEFTIVRVLTAAELVTAVAGVLYLGGIPHDSVAGNSDQYNLISVGIMTVLGGARTTPMIFSIQSGSNPAWSNLATGITAPVTSLQTSTTVNAGFNTGTAAASTGFLRLITTQQGVGFTGADLAVLTMKFTRFNGLRT